MKIVTKHSQFYLTDNFATGEMARSERKTAGFSLRAVAIAMHISAPYLSDLERGHRTWSLQLSTSFNSALTGLKIGRIEKAKKKAHKVDFLIGKKK